MKNQQTIIRLTVILLLIISNLSGMAQQSTAKPGPTYEVDTKQSKLLWEAPKPKHFGFILFNSGSLNADGAGHYTTGTFSINMNSLRSQDSKNQKDNDEIDAMLKSNNYFAMATYPAASMVVTTIKPTNNPTKFKVSGNLTMKGYTNPIEFIATIKPLKTDVKITGTFKIDRMKWHVTGKTENFIYGLKDNLQDAMVPDEIPIALDLLLHQK